MVTASATEKIKTAGHQAGSVMECSGHGPSILLVHGLGGPATWERVVPILSQAFTVFVPHLSGFGDSHDHGVKISADSHAEELRFALEARGLTGVTVAGISYGALVTALLAERSPRLVSSVVLISPAGLREYPALVGKSFVMRPALFLLKHLLVRIPSVAGHISRRSFHNISARPPDLTERYLQRLVLPGHADGLVKVLKEILSLGPVLPGIVRGMNQPVRLVWGDHDRMIPPSHASRLTAVRPGLTATLIPASGHSVPLERPAEICRIITEAATGNRQSSRVEIPDSEAGRRARPTRR